MTTYLESFEARGKTSPSWHDALRAEAMERFAKTGFPTVREEEWRFTNVAPIARIPYRPPAAESKLPAELAGAAEGAGAGGVRLVFVNGLLSRALSRVEGLPRGMRLGSLAEAVASDRERLEPLIGRTARGEGNAFAALNTAFAVDGAFVAVPDGVELDRPVEIVFVSAPGGSPVLSSPRNVILAGERSRVSVVETYVGSEGASFTNTLTDIIASPGSAVEHTTLQRETHAAHHVSNLFARLGRDSRLVNHSISLGGALARNDILAVLEGEGAECTLNGLFIGSGDGHVDNHTVIDHALPHGVSRESYKGIMSGRSRGVFDGKIIVRPGASKTDAKQSNKNLLLSDEALVDTKPQLEIYTDDVKCNHAATIGRLDEASLFYLRSRGLAHADARAMLIRAFAGEIIGRVGSEPHRRAIETEVGRLILNGGGRPS